MPHLTPTRSLLLAGALAVSITGTSIAQERKLHAHEHGESKLRIAQEGNQVSFELQAPGADIVGFERAAKSDDEKNLVKSALANFKKPESIFSVPAEAGCTSKLGEAEFEIEGEHAEFHVKWALTCSDVSKATTLKTTFFTLFTNAKHVEVEAVGGAGQSEYEMEKGEEEVDLSKVIGG